MSLIRIYWPRQIDQEIPDQVDFVLVNYKTYFRNIKTISREEKQKLYK